MRPRNVDPAHVTRPPTRTSSLAFRHDAQDASSVCSHSELQQSPLQCLSQYQELCRRLAGAHVHVGMLLAEGNARDGEQVHNIIYITKITALV